MTDHPKTLILTGLILLVGVPLIYHAWPQVVPIGEMPCCDPQAYIEETGLPGEPNHRVDEYIFDLAHRKITYRRMHEDSGFTYAHVVILRDGTMDDYEHKQVEQKQ